MLASSFCTLQSSFCTLQSFAAISQTVPPAEADLLSRTLSRERDTSQSLGDDTVVPLAAGELEQSADDCSKGATISEVVLVEELPVSVLICVNYQPHDGSTDEKRGGGRRSAGGGGGGEEEATVDFSWEAIPLVETFITGLMAAVVTAFIVLLCSMVFKWGNSRMRRCAVVRGCE